MAGIPPDALEVQLVRIEVKLDQALSGFNDHETRLRMLEGHATGDHGKRITALERWRYALPLTALCAVLSCVTTIIVAIIGR